jgi:hypothetical protein
MSDELVYCTKVTPEDVYDKDVLADIYGLKGLNSIIELRQEDGVFKVVDFRPPTSGEIFITDMGLIIIAPSCVNFGPRLIVKQGRPVTRKTVTFTETGEVRQATKGEWARSTQSSFTKFASESYFPYIICAQSESTTTSYEFD